MINSKDIKDRFDNLMNDTEMNCTEEELNHFMMCGLLISSNNKYLTRNGEEIKIKLLSNKVNSFNIKLNDLINNANTYAKENNEYKVFCMTEDVFNKYKKNDLIVEKDNKTYCITNSSELWLVYLVN